MSCGQHGRDALPSCSERIFLVLRRQKEQSISPAETYDLIYFLLYRREESTQQIPSSLFSPDLCTHNLARQRERANDTTIRGDLKAGEHSGVGLGSRHRSEALKDNRAGRI